MNLGHSCEISARVRVAVTRQVGEDDFRLRPSRPAYFEEVNAARASRRRTGAGDLVADQGVDHAGFAHIRPSQEGDFRQAGSREVIGTRRRRHKSCHYLMR